MMPKSQEQRLIYLEQQIRLLEKQVEQRITNRQLITLKKMDRIRLIKRKIKAVTNTNFASDGVLC